MFPHAVMAAQSTHVPNPPPKARSRLKSALLITGLTLIAHSAVAGGTLYNFDLPAKPLPLALVSLSESTGLSIGGLDPARCRAVPTALKGRLSVEQALNKLLSKSQCVAEPAGNGIWRLKARPAPSPATSAPPPAESITVTATRSPQRIGTAAASLSVLTGGQIADNDSSLNALSPRVAGLLMTDRGPGRDKIFLRGLTDSILTGRTQATVGLYLDDSPILYNAPNPDLLLVDMNSVEVLKGPQGALYGEGTISGVLRLVTNKPSLQKSFAALGLGYGQGQEGEPSRRQLLVGNKALIPDKLGLRLVAYHDLSGGYLRSSPASRASNTSSRDGGRLSLLWKIDDRWQATYGLTAQAIDSRDSQYVSSTAHNDAAPDPGKLTRDVLIREPNRSDFLNNALSFEHKGRTGVLKMTFNALSHRTRSRLDAHDIAAYLRHPDPGGFIVYDEVSDVRLATQEINFTSQRERRFRYIAGLFAAQSREDFNPKLTDLNSQTRFYDEARRDDIDTVALYGELAYDLTPRWTLVLGVRASQTDLETRSQTDELQITGTLSRMNLRRLHSENLSHQLNLSYRPDARTVFYVLSADGYRTGGFNTSSLSATGPVPQTYKGDYLRSLEAGTKLLLKDNRLSIRIAAFHLVSLKTQSDQLQTSGLPVTINLGTGSNNGLEIESDWRLSDSLRLHGAAQFNNTRLDQPNTAYIKTRDANMPLVASSSYSLSADWLTLNEETPLWGTATLAYRGRSRLNLGGIDVPVMGGYTTLDLTLTAMLPKVRLSVSLDNATNSRGNSFAYGNPFSSSIAPQSTPLRPRTLWVMARFGL